MTDPTAGHIPDQRLGGPMGGLRPRPRRRSALVVLAAMLVSAWGSAAAHEAQDPDHWHVSVSLGDDSRTEVVEPADRLSHRFDGALVVQEPDATDHQPFLTFPLPQGASLLTFAPADANGTNRSVSADGGASARFTWPAGAAPPVGSVVTNVSLLAVREVDLSEELEVRWAGLHPDNVTIRLELPTGYTVNSGGQLQRETFHLPPGRKVWSTGTLDRPVLEFTVRSTYDGPDPAFSDRPNPAGGFLVVAAIGLVSGLTWVMGKRMEARHAHAEDDHPPDEDDSPDQEPQDPTRS